jgi:thioredoxin-like negative regulator of GroEL
MQSCAVKVDAYAYPELATHYGLHGIPMFLLVRDGRVLGRMTSCKGRDYWLSVIREHWPR